MNIFRKITSLLLLPVMLLSFMGASLHLHVCGHTGAIYAEVHFTEKPREDHSKSCCHQEKENPYCCNTSCEIPDEQNEGSCCLDLQKKIVTDKNFSPSIKSIKISPAALDLYGIASSGTPEYTAFTESCHPDYRTAWIPPPIQSRTVLIL